MNLVSKTRLIFASCARNYTAGANSPLVVRTQNNKAFLCWHPDNEHPYEFSKEIVRDENKLQEGDVILRDNVLAASKADHMKRVTRSHGPNWKTLGKVFRDDWHQFRPR